MRSKGYEVSVDSLTDADWDQVLSHFDDATLYQTSTYGRVHWGTKSLSRLTVKVDGEVRAAAQLRIMRAPVLNRGIAYSRWGPVFQLKDRPLDGKILSYAIEALREEYVEKRRLMLRILPNAFQGKEREQMFQKAFGDSKINQADLPVDRTIRVDIRPPLDEIRKKLDQKWRNQLNRSEKNGLVIVEGDGPKEYAIFLQLYQEMMARKNFETTVSVEEFATICAELASQFRFRILLAYSQGAPVAGLVGSMIGDTGIYLLGATNEEGMKIKGAYLLQWTMIQGLKEKGCSYYDLGGIDPELNPGVYHFKQGFSGEEVQRASPVEMCEDFVSRISIRAAELFQQIRKDLRQRKAQGPAQTQNTSNSQ